MNTTTYVATATKDGKIERKFSSTCVRTAKHVYDVFVAEGRYDNVCLAQVTVETKTDVTDLQEWKKP